MQKLILFAHPAEAAATLKRLEAQETSPGLYRSESLLILISGMGSLQAACGVVQFAGIIDEVWNVGVCGSLNDHLEPESFHWVGRVGKHLLLPEGSSDHAHRLSHSVHPPLDNGDGARLLTSDYPIYGAKLRKELARAFDLVDMEGYGVATAAKKLGIPYQIGKIVSDRAEEGEWEALRKRLPTLSERLADLILSHIEPSPTSVGRRDTP